MTGVGLPILDAESGQGVPFLQMSVKVYHRGLQNLLILRFCYLVILIFDNFKNLILSISYMMLCFLCLFLFIIYSHSFNIQSSNIKLISNYASISTSQFQTVVVSEE